MQQQKVRFLILLVFVSNSCLAETQIFQNWMDLFNGCEWWQKKEVSVMEGTVQGSTMISGKGKQFCSFRGIPFAKPPIGKYRFQPPQPPEPWTGTLDATKESPQCIRAKLFTTTIGGQEDCLYLSVFTPQLKSSRDKLLDVLVWIYPGEFYFGSSSVSLTGPEYLMDKDVILVYFNHRLGVFGFLSTGDDEAPGNFGLKDQIAALRWVQKNIASFGGNASSVTLFGYSSGAASGHLHMMSTLSKGLFHRVISMEGSAIDPWARGPDPLYQAQKQALAVNCPTNSTSSLVACLKEMDAYKLAVSIRNLFPWWILSSSGYTPVVENKTVLNPNPFLTEDPLVLIREGRFERVPWIIGGTTMGVALFGIPAFSMSILHQQVISYFKIIMTKLLMLNVSVPQSEVENVAEKIFTFYMGVKRQVTAKDFTVLLEMLNDRMLLYGRQKSAELHAKAGHKDIYRYTFAYRGLVSFGQLSNLKNFGTVHGDELRYLFKMFLSKLVTPFDLEVKELMLSLITNFAKYGNPTPRFKTGNYIMDELQWLPMLDESKDYTNLRYLNIGQVITSGQNIGYLNYGLGPVQLNMGVNQQPKSMSFWESLPLIENCNSDCSSSTK